MNIRVPIAQEVAAELGARLGDRVLLTVGGVDVVWVRVRTLDVQKGTEWMHAVLEIEGVPEPDLIK